MRAQERTAALPYTPHSQSTSNRCRERRVTALFLNDYSEFLDLTLPEEVQSSHIETAQARRRIRVYDCPILAHPSPTHPLPKTLTKVVDAAYQGDPDRDRQYITTG